MSTAVHKSLEEHRTSTDDSVELCNTCGENVNISMASVRSDVSRSIAKTDADSNLAEIGQNDIQPETLPANENSVDVIDIERTEVLKPAPRIDAAAGAELLLKANNDSNKWIKSKQSSSEGNPSAEADDLSKSRDAHLATENSILTDAHHGSRLSVRSEVLEEAVNRVRDGAVAEIDASDDITASRTSLVSRKSHTRRRKTNNETESSSRAVSSTSVRSDKSRNVTDVDIAASRTSVRSLKPHTKNQVDRAEPGSIMPLVASEVSARSDELQNVTEIAIAVEIASSRTIKPRTVQEMTKSQTGRAEAGSLVASVVSVRSDDAREVNDDSSGNVVRSNTSATISQRSDDLEADSIAPGCRSSVKSVNSEGSSNSSSVIISKPPKRVTANKAVKDAQPTDDAVISQTTGDSVSFVLHFCNKI